MASIGRTSYHIFLVQILYFALFAELISHVIQTKTNTLAFYLAGSLILLANIVFCVACGFVFMNVAGRVERCLTKILADPSNTV